MRALLACALALSACNTRPVSAVDPTATAQETTDFQVSLNRNVDILFVIDDSFSMDAEQASLTANFPRMIEELEGLEDGLPNVHLGVISTDVGAGSGIGGCNGAGKDGQLQSSPRAPGCSPPDGAFIIDIADDAGGRTRNYSGTLADTFSCIARLGVDGCGFEQPLEAVRRALAHPANSGFIRPDAYLAIVFITDEDDCSTRDPRMFTTDESELGPLDSFRCFEYGVECDPDAPRLLGPKSDCRPRTGSPFMYDVQAFIEEVRALKPTDSLIMTFAIAGDLAPVEVVLADDGDYALAYSCGQDAPGEAVPPIRLKRFLDAFPTGGLFTICDEDLTAAMTAIGEAIADKVGSRCFEGVLPDTDPDTPGIQPECSVSEVRDPGTDQEVERVLEACDTPSAPETSGNRPCHLIVEDRDQCPDTATGLSAQVHYDDGAVVPPGTLIRAHCVVE
jgi:hypothetical protein